MVKKIVSKKSGKTNGKRKPKKDNLANINYAFILYCQGIQQNEIADRCDTSPQTITEWKKKFDWETKRAAKTISMDELVNKCLIKINKLLDDENFKADDFAKAVAQLKSLRPSNTVDDNIMSFLAFQDYLLERRHEESISEDFIKQVTAWQDRFVKAKMGWNG